MKLQCNFALAKYEAGKLITILRLLEGQGDGQFTHRVKIERSSSPPPLKIIFTAIQFKIKNRIYSEHVLLRRHPLQEWMRAGVVK